MPKDTTITADDDHSERESRGHIIGMSAIMNGQMNTRLEKQSIMMNWGELAATSHYQTACAVRQKIFARDFEEAVQGIEELIEALSRSDKRALRSQLTRLMAHIFKWRIEPSHRSRSWVATITNARIEIASILADEPNQKRNIPVLWEACLDAAKKIARDETGIEPNIDMLTEDEVFVVPYTLPKLNGSSCAMFREFQKTPFPK